MKVVKSQPEISQEQKNRIKALYDGVVRSLRKSLTAETRRVTPRNSCNRRSHHLLPREELERNPFVEVPICVDVGIPGRLGCCG